MSRRRSCRTRRFRRSAVTILETTVAMFLLGVAAVAAAQLSSVCTRQQRTLERRGVALQVAASVVERWQAAEWEQTSPESTANVKLPDWAADRLPGGRLVLKVVEVAEPRPARRLLARVAWSNDSTSEPQPADGSAPRDESPRAAVELTGWRFAP